MVVYAGGRRGFVTGVANFDNIGVRHENQDGITIYKASDLHQRPDPSPDRRFAIDVLTAEQLAIATETRDILQPVLDGEVQGRKALGELIAPHRNRPDLRLSIATAYRRIAAYKATDDISAFLPDRTWKPRAQSKVKQSAAEQAMETAIQRHILCKKPLKYQTIHKEMLPAICRALGCNVPPYWTLVRRINEVKRRDPYAVEVAQKGRRVADHHYRQNRGSHPWQPVPSPASKQTIGMCIASWWTTPRESRSAAPFSAWQPASRRACLTATISATNPPTQASSG